MKQHGHGGVPGTALHLWLCTYLGQFVPAVSCRSVFCLSAGEIRCKQGRDPRAGGWWMDGGWATMMGCVLGGCDQQNGRELLTTRLDAPDLSRRVAL